MSRVAGIFVVLSGAASLCAWVFAIEWPLSLRTLGVMRPEAALVLLLAGSSLILWQPPKKAVRIQVARGLGALVSISGLLALVRVGFGWEIDALGFLPPLERPLLALNTAVSLLLAGGALTLVDTPAINGRCLWEWLAAAAGFIVFAALTGYLYGVHSLAAPLSLRGMPLQTALTLLALVLVLGILTVRPGCGWMNRFLSTGPEGVLTRQLLPKTVGVLLVLGWLVEAGARHRLYEPAQMAALLVTVAAASIGYIIFDKAKALARLEASRCEAAAACATSERRLEAIITSAMDAIVTMDKEQKIILFNPAAEKLFGYRAEEVINRNLDLLIPPALRHAHGSHVSGFAKRGETSRRMAALGVVKGLRANGEEFPIESSISQVQVGGEVYFTAILRDVTERQRAEALQQARDAAEAASRAKDELLAVLSHELRTPLSPVLLAAQMMKCDERLPADTLDSAAMIHRNIELQAQLIDDLLDQTRIERGKLQLHLAPVNVNEKVRHVIEMCAGEVALKNIQVRFNESTREATALADAPRLQQVLWNLLKNAVKFTPEGGSVEIRTARVDAIVKIEVHDTGIGIEPEVLAKVFTPFEQGGVETTRRYGGLGLGLSISRKIAEMHGGSLSAQSEGAGRGATFTLTLPAVNGTHFVSKSDGATHKFRILLVEDHADTARTLERLLTRRGHAVCLAGSIAEALEIAGVESFDLLLSDIGLPDRNGCDVMRGLRARCSLRGIAMSGYGMEEDLRQSRDAGFDEHLVKPVDPEQLDAAIHAVMMPPAGRLQER